MPLPEWLQPKARDESAGAVGDPKPAPADTPPSKPAPDDAPQAEPAGDEAPDPGQKAEDDQVLSMLASIERQLERLGSVQQEHDEQLTSLVQKAGRQDEDSGEVYPDSLDALEAVGDEESSRRRELEQREAELEAEQERLKALAAKQQATESNDEVKRQLADARSEIEQLTEKALRSQRELQARMQELAEASAELESVQARVAELEASDPGEAQGLREEIKELTMELRQRDEALADYRKRIEHLNSPDGTAAGEGGAMQEMIQRQRRQIERLTEQLTELKSEDDPEEVRWRDARIAELQEQLEQARGESPGPRSVARLVAGVGDALRQVRGKGSGGGARVSELEDRVEQLTVECERLRDELEQARVESAGVDIETAAAETALCRRIDHLEEELAEARAGATASTEEEDSVGPVLQDNQQLRQMQESLAAGEEEMIRQWARPRAVILYGWLVGVLIVLGVLSSLAANHFFPATLSASVTVLAKPRDGTRLNDADAGAWRLWHMTLLADAGFLKTVAKRLADQRLDRYSDPEALGRRLREDLSMDSPKPDELVLTLAGTDPDEITVLLDTVVGTLAMESSRQADQKDRAVVDVRGERRDETGRLRYAALNPDVIRDRRFVAGIVFFALALVISALAFSRIKLRLLHSRRVIDEDDLEITEPTL